MMDSCNCAAIWEQRNPIAQFNYGVLLATGNGIQMNKSLAAHYFRLSADDGLSEAQYRYAQIPIDGVEAEKNERVGIAYLRRAANQGLVSPQF
jgi:TPR repeat protein